MQICRFGTAILLLTLAVVATASQALAQSDDELQTLARRIVELRRNREYDKAVPLAERYAEAVRTRHGEDAMVYAEALVDLAYLLDYTDRFAEKAEPHYNRAVAIAVKSLESGAPRVAHRVGMLADLLWGNNRKAEAELLRRRVVEKFFGPDRYLSDDELHALVRRFFDLKIAGKNEEAIQIAERYAEGVSARYGGEAIEYARALLYLGGEPLDRRAFAIAEKSLASDYHFAAGRLQRIAFERDIDRRRDDAVLLRRRVLAMVEKVFGPDHPNVAHSLHYLAFSFSLADGSEAEQLMRRALAIEEKSFGADHPNVARRLNALATRLVKEGARLFDTGRLEASRLAEVESLLRRLIDIDEKGSDRLSAPDRLSVSKNLGILVLFLQLGNRLADAEPLMRRAIAFHERHGGPDHPSVAGWLTSLSQVLTTGYRLAEAEAVLRRALAIAQKHDPRRDFQLAPDALYGLGWLLRETNRHAEAEELERSWGRGNTEIAQRHRRELASAETTFGPDHPKVAERLRSLGLSLLPSEAEPLLRRAVAIAEASFGPDHPDVAHYLRSLAMSLGDTNQLAEAESLLGRVFAVAEKHSNHIGATEHLHDLFALLRRANRLPDGEALIRRGLALHERSLGSEYQHVVLLNLLGNVLRAANRLAEAEDVLRHAAAIDGKLRPPRDGHRPRGPALNSLAELLREMSRHAEAEVLLQNWDRN